MTILFVAANPSAYLGLQIDKEIRAIAKVLDAPLRDLTIDIYPLLAAQYDDLPRKLWRLQPTIVHFSGHGEQSDAGPALILEDHKRNPVPISPKKFAELFKGETGNIRAVVLNACHSAPHAEAVREHVDHVIGMARPITDETALAFSHAFYEAIAHGKTIVAAYEHGKSHLEACGLDRTPESTPQLYQRIPYIHREDIEGKALKDLSTPGKPVIIWGPEGCGRSTIRQHLLRKIQETDGDQSRIIDVDLAALLPYQTHDGLLENLTRYIAGQSNKASWLEKLERRQKNLLPVLYLEKLLKDCLLPAVSNRLVLVIEADALWDKSFHRDFFTTLRSLCGHHGDLWSRLRLMILSTSTPSMHGDSPLENLAKPLSLRDFNPDQVAKMARHYRVSWDKDEYERHLRPLVGGLPYFLHEILSHEHLSRKPPDEIARDKDALVDLFSDELEDLCKRIDADESIKKAIAHMIVGEGHAIDSTTRNRLFRAGLIESVNSNKLQYGIHEEYLRRNLRRG